MEGDLDEILPECDREARFVQAVKLVFSRWTAFKLLLDNFEPTPRSADERFEELCSLTAEYFKEETTRVTPESLSINLEEFMASHYSEALIEDNSLDDISEHLCLLYNQLMSGNVSGLNSLLSSRDSVSLNVSKSQKVASCSDSSEYSDDLEQEEASGEVMH